ncbi:MAG: hypothetical protein MK033_12270 [Candidatus Caenarcaniphilales bacterium]|nr:hypothetical protein [Candidatus Caenarcaniphilales bacterium]
MKNAYGTRSAFIHGNPKQENYENLEIQYPKVISTLKECLKIIYESRRDLIEIPSRERTKKLILE